MAYGQIMDAMLTLAELRERQGVSQSALAQALDVSQSNISQIEHKTDLFLSTVRAYVEALGGDVHIVATFPDGQSVEITPPTREAMIAVSR